MDLASIAFPNVNEASLSIILPGAQIFAFYLLDYSDNHLRSVTETYTVFFHTSLPKISLKVFIASLYSSIQRQFLLCQLAQVVALRVFDIHQMLLTLLFCAD